LLIKMICVPALLYSADIGSAGMDIKPGISNDAQIDKTVKKNNRSKKKTVSDPERLKEIAEKSILAVEGGDDSSNLELPVNGRITSTVGLRPDPINGDIRMHRGIDIAIMSGTPVKPVAGGRVAYSGMQPGYGNMVIIQHDDGMISVYAHHSRNLVKAGDRVGKETTVAYSGSTGHSTGPHLHFEAWQSGVNVTSAYLPNFVGNRIEESTHESLEKTNLRKVIMSDGTILFVEVTAKKKKRSVPDGQISPPLYTPAP
jgi:murein DD-endopeptidase MepM/ murein hydrolase activator NlpD